MYLHVYISKSHQVKTQHSLWRWNISMHAHSTNCAGSSRRCRHVYAFTCTPKPLNNDNQLQPSFHFLTSPTVSSEVKRVDHEALRCSNWSTKLSGRVPRPWSRWNHEFINQTWMLGDVMKDPRNPFCCKRLNIWSMYVRCHAFRGDFQMKSMFGVGKSTLILSKRIRLVKHQLRWGHLWSVNPHVESWKQSRNQKPTAA